VGELVASRIGDIHVLQLVNPERLNAWTVAMRAEMVRYLTHEVDLDTPTAVVVTGRGGGFCAGQDLREFVDLDPHADHMATFEQLYRVLLEFPRPTIAALDGVAAGSGMQLALLCDYRVASNRCRMGQPEIRHGMPSITGTWLLRETVGPVRARSLALSTEFLTSKTLLSLGMVDEVVDKPESEFLDYAVERASQLAQHPVRAYAVSKSWANRDILQNLATAFAAARDMHGAASHDGAERAGALRFLERHPLRQAHAAADAAHGGQRTGADRG
jgi:Enoyl-CoA hydratase/carnithine racemase